MTNKPVLLHPLPPVDAVAKKNALDTLDAVRKRVEDGTTLRFGLVEARANGEYSTEFTMATHKREDAAMLIDLALRLLGFVSRNKDDELI